MGFIGWEMEEKEDRDGLMLMCMKCLEEWRGKEYEWSNKVMLGKEGEKEYIIKRVMVVEEMWIG